MRKVQQPIIDARAEIARIGQIASKDELSTLARDPSWVVRFGVASNTHTSVSDLERLTRYDHDLVIAQANRALRREPRTYKHEIGLDVCILREHLGLTRNKVALSISIATGRSVSPSIIKSIEIGETAYTIDSLLQVLDVVGGSLHISSAHSCRAEKKTEK